MRGKYSIYVLLFLLVGMTYSVALAAANENPEEQIEEIEVIEEIVELEAAPAMGIRMPSIWPIHAVLTAYCAILLIISVFIARNKLKDALWLPKHKTIGLVVLGVLLIGFGVAFYMVSLGPKGHFTVGHSYFGLVAIILVILVPVVGWTMLKLPKIRVLRKIHVWAGRLTITLMIIAGALGLTLVGLL